MAPDLVFLALQGAGTLAERERVVWVSREPKRTWCCVASNTDRALCSDDTI